MGQQQPDQKRQGSTDTTRDQSRTGQKDLGRDTDSKIDRSQSTDASKAGFDKKQSGNR